MSIGHWIACREPLLLMQPSTCHLQRTKQRQTAKRLSFPLKCQNVNKKHQNLLNRSPHHLKPPVRRTLESAIPVLRMEKYFSQRKSMADIKITSAPHLP